MNRRDALALLGAATIPGNLLRSARGWAQEQPKADFTLHIGPTSVELAPKWTVKTTGYNGSSPGPLLRIREGQMVSLDVFNDTSAANVVHWHGLQIPSAVDGSMEEGTPMIPPGGKTRLTFTPRPAGFRWYHTHTFAGKDFHLGGVFRR